MKLFVAGIPYDMDDEELTEVFEKFGPVSSAKVAMDKVTGKSRGFAFVQMVNDEDGNDAIKHLVDITIGKRTMVVKEAEERQGGGGSGGGGGYRPSYPPRRDGPPPNRY